MSKRSAHFEYSFLIDKCSCKIVKALLSDIFNFSTISRNFNFTIGQNEFMEDFFIFYFVFSGTTAEFGWPERLASFVSVRPRLK